VRAPARAEEPQARAGEAPPRSCRCSRLAQQECIGSAAECLHRVERTGHVVQHTQAVRSHEQPARLAQRASQLKIRRCLAQRREDATRRLDHEGRRAVEPSDPVNPRGNGVDVNSFAFAVRRQRRSDRLAKAIQRMGTRVLHPRRCRLEQGRIAFAGPAIGARATAGLHRFQPGNGCPLRSQRSHQPNGRVALAHAGTGAQHDPTLRRRAAGGGHASVLGTRQSAAMEAWELRGSRDGRLGGAGQRVGGARRGSSRSRRPAVRIPGSEQGGRQ
jgi:hypothetical protein